MPRPCELCLGVRFAHYGSASPSALAANTITPPPCHGEAVTVGREPTQDPARFVVWAGLQNPPCVHAKSRHAACVHVHACAYITTAICNSNQWPVRNFLPSFSLVEGGERVYSKPSHTLGAYAPNNAKTGTVFHGHLWPVTNVTGQGSELRS